jgi:DNA polymerase I-like protein with 3'-5' exonuclease and polymerase domains
MKLLVIDFETYYDKTYSLSKLTTEEYVRDSRFEVIGVSVGEYYHQSGTAALWFSGTHEETKAFLEQFDWDNCAAVAHNAMFDMAILSWRFGIKPKYIIDTLSMARAVHGTEVGGSLKALAEYYGVGKKGTEVLNALGKRREDFTEAELSAYGAYCSNDVELTYQILTHLSIGFPMSELRLIDLTIRMFSEPVLQVASELLEDHLKDVQEQKRELLSKTLVDKDVLMSNQQLAELLRSCGVEPPTKISLRTGKETYAFAKSDEEFTALLEHENPFVQAFVAARLGVKSTIEETRTQRFIDIASRGTLPIPLRYYAAHTGRWGGDDKVNMQNLPSRGPNAGVIKCAILPPSGYVFIDCDSSQIEARTLAWLAGQDDLVEAFDRGEDVYKIMASAIYGKPVTEVTDKERFVGKTTILGCIAAGTRVLCETGWKPIETVTTTDRLWDGENWVCHQGLLEKGLKETVSLCGSWLTPDHKILCGTEWKETQSVVQDESTLSQALVTGAARLPLEALSGEYGEALSQLSLSAIVDDPSIQSTDTTLKTLRLLAAQSVLNKQQVKNAIGSMLKPCRMIPIGQDCSTDFLLLSHGAITQETLTTKTMGVGAYGFTTSGEKTEPSFSLMYRRLKGGITRAWKWIALTTIKGMSQTTYGSQPEARTWVTEEESSVSRKKLMTYDLAYAGPNNRFTIWTDMGPVIVHNCGYGMGAAKFKAQLLTFGADVELKECQRIIDVYRSTYERIPILWRACGDALDSIIADQQTTIGRDGILEVQGVDGIRLPNGLLQKYPNLRREQDKESGNYEYRYDTKKGRTVVATKIYGGKVVENICQALARIVIGEQMLEVSKQYRVVMTVHDAIGCIAPEVEAESALGYVKQCMKQRPTWAPDLPLDCKGSYAYSYGECKD